MLSKGGFELEFEGDLQLRDVGCFQQAFHGLKSQTRLTLVHFSGKTEVTTPPSAAFTKPWPKPSYTIEYKTGY